MMIIVLKTHNKASKLVNALLNVLFLTVKCIWYLQICGCIKNLFRRKLILKIFLEYSMCIAFNLDF